MMTIRRSLDLFLEDRAAYCSAATLEKYGEDVWYFFRFLEDVLHLSLDKRYPEGFLFRDFVVNLRSRGIRNASIRSYCRSVKTYLRWCYERDYCPDYLKGVKLPRDDSEPKQPLYAEEVAAVDAEFDLSSEAGKRDYCIVHLMLDCGLRCGEVLRLQAGHIDRQHNILHVVNSKGNKSRMVLVPDFLLDALSGYLHAAGRDSGLVFKSLKNDGPLTQNAVKMLFQHLKKKTGIERLHAHLLRHTFATSYLLGGGNLEYLRVFMGHYDYTVTKSYSSLAAQCRMLGADIYPLDPIFFSRGY